MNNDLLNLAKNNLSIQDVYLRECNITQKQDFDTKIPGYPEVEIQFLHKSLAAKRADITIKDQEKPISLVKAPFETIFRVLPPRGSEEMAGVDLTNMEQCNEKALVFTRAIFIAEYACLDIAVTNEAIAEFCKHHVGYHVWPYWRELAQSIAWRLRLPSIIPPLYKVPNE